MIESRDMAVWEKWREVFLESVVRLGYYRTELILQALSEFILPDDAIIEFAKERGE